MFSTSLLEGWAKNGRMTGGISIVFLVFTALLVPLISGKNFYCYFICPFGSLQEFFYRISPIRILKAGKTLSPFKRIRYVLLGALMLSMLSGMGLSADMQEPFAAFRWHAAGWIPLVIALAALTASLLGVNRPWCTYFCSSGALLDLLRGKKKKRNQ